MEKIKNLFKTSKKTIITIVLALVILIILGTCFAYAASAIAESSSIGGENAKNFACADAGVDPAEIQLVSTKFDYEDGQFVYEVEFIADGVEYEYTIKASDGTVLKKETEVINIVASSTDVTESATTENVDTDASESTTTNSSSTSNKTTTSTSENSTSTSNTTQSSSSTTSNTSTSSSDTTTTITLSTAKSTALADAGLSESQVTYTEAKLTWDDGIQVYDIEFYTSTHEYEYEINASTGKIIDKSVEAFQQTTTSTSTTSSSTISVDEAKTIAVEQFGFTTSEVTFKKAKLEYDDGIKVYEIEFYKNGTEYEVTINANTGSVIEYDVD